MLTYFLFYECFCSVLNTSFFRMHIFLRLCFHPIELTLRINWFTIWFSSTVEFSLILGSCGTIMDNEHRTSRIGLSEALNIIQSTGIT